MKKVLIMILLVGFVLVGCGGSDIGIEVEEAPYYKDGESYPIVISVNDDEEMEITATLEMERMDHGIIEVIFRDRGDGTYEGEVELPMAGEWIANVVAEKDGETYEDILTFYVEEG